MGSHLHTEHLSIGYASKALLADVNIDVRAGELIALVGANGVGKSTLLRTIAGLHAPLAGRVLAMGDPVHGLSARERARRVSIVLTGRPQGGMLDVRTLIALGRQPWTGAWGGFTAADEEAVDSAAKRVGAEHLLDRSIDTCSDGECQKVLIARALAQSTPTILLDEPTAYLDLPNRAGIVRMLRTIAHEEGKAVLFSTHDIQLAMDLDKVILMRRDAPLWQGTPAEALGTGELQRAFASAAIQFDPANGTHRFLP